MLSDQNQYVIMLSCQSQSVMKQFVLIRVMKRERSSAIRNDPCDEPHVFRKTLQIIVFPMELLDLWSGRFDFFGFSTQNVAFCTNHCIPYGIIGFVITCTVFPLWYQWN